MSENEIRMPDTSRLIVSSSPHFHTTDSVSKIMLWVIAALLPVTAVSVWHYGLPALEVIFFCTAGCVAVEVLCARLMRRPIEINDGSALVTGLLLGLNLPPGTPIWICLVGALLAIGLGKMVFGGIGCNPFNPAIVGRVGLLIAFPQTMNTWMTGPDAYTTATPLKMLSDAHLAGQEGVTNAMSEMLSQMSYGDWLLLNQHGGSIGEISALALILGGILLIALNIIRWQIPFFYILTVAVFTGLAWLSDSSLYAPPQYHLLSGGLLLGAFFMATDMVTSPVSRTGAIVFAIGCGIITCVIRLWGSYPEGVSFAILIMNALTPLIDRMTAGKPFGAPKKKGLKL